MDSLVTDIFEKLKERNWMIVTAESCTGGLIAGRLTEVPGSSAYVDRGFVTYTNQSKLEMLAVPAALIENNGAVSAPVAEAMAKGALQASKAQIAVSVTGIAGPTGGTDMKPVGLVYISVATWTSIKTVENIFAGNREAIRMQAVETALKLMLEVMA